MKVLVNYYLEPTEIDNRELKVEFSKHEYIEIEIKENYIRLRGCRQLLVLPEVSNSLQIHLGDMDK